MGKEKDRPSCCVIIWVRSSNIRIVESRWAFVISLPKKVQNFGFDFSGTAKFRLAFFLKSSRIDFDTGMKITTDNE